MTEPLLNAQIVAKLQYYLDYLKQNKIEKETLYITLSSIPADNDLDCIKDKILIYEEIIEEYYGIFKDILHR